MTLEEVIESPALWEALSPQEQETFFAPMLDVTRPEREIAVHKERKGGGSKMSERQMKFSLLSKEKQQLMKALLDEEGIEI